MQCGSSEEDAPLEWRAPSASPSEIKKFTTSQDDRRVRFVILSEAKDLTVRSDTGLGWAPLLRIALAHLLLDPAGGEERRGRDDRGDQRGAERLLGLEVGLGLGEEIAEPGRAHQEL